MTTSRSQAWALLGDAGTSERLVVCCPLGGLALDLADVVQLATHAQIRPKGDLQPFPPGPVLINATGLKRKSNGVLWTAQNDTARVALGCDGSVGVRARLHHDRKGPGTQRERGDIGLFSTLEGLYTAVAFSQSIAARSDLERVPTRIAFRVEFHGVSGARLMCDVPSRVHDMQRRNGEPEITPNWPTETQSSDEPLLRFAGEFDRKIEAHDVSIFLDDFAQRLALYFAVEEHVRSLCPGALVLDAYVWSGA